MGHDSPSVQDADDLHPASNVAKLRAGIPLTDEDRRPWLQLLNERLKHWAQGNVRGVLACSALKRAYRSILQDAACYPVKIINNQKLNQSIDFCRLTGAWSFSSSK